MSGPFPWFNVPRTGQTLGVTKVPINSNFQTIYDYVSINHFPVDDGRAGKHRFVEIPSSGSIPSPLDATESTLYTKDALGYPQFYATPGTSGNEYQLTCFSTTNFSDFGGFAVGGGAQRGWTFLPGGLILNYGKVIFGSASGTYTFAKAFSASPYSISLQAQNTSDATRIIVDNANISSTSFKVLTNSVNYIFYYTAIGPA